MATARILAPEDRRIGRKSQSDALTLARALPRLTVEARRIAASAVAGIHGRRRAGQGDSFWQFRNFSSGEAANRIDWRRSARDGRLSVREREWEAAETVWLWLDRSPSMAYVSSLSRYSKLERAIVLGLAAADMLVRGGERAGLFRLTQPIASQRVIERLAESLIFDERSPGAASDLPPPHAIGPREEIILVGDFIGSLASIETTLGAIAARGGRGHLIQIADPAEEIFPFTGETEFRDPQDGSTLRVGDAASFATVYCNRLAAHREGLRRIVNRLGWTLALHRTDHSASEALYALMAALNGEAPGMVSLGTKSASLETSASRDSASRQPPTPKSEGAL
jgi:uncharacterized protein (DUF58 family)